MVWGVLFGMPYILSNELEEEGVFQRILVFSWFPLGLYVIIFYFNYFFLVERLMFTQRIAWFILSNIVLIAAVIFVKEYLWNFYFETLFPHPEDKTPPPVKFFIYMDLVRFSIPLIFSIAVKTTERWIKTEAERQQAEKAKLQTELQHLKYQLQPHFFFNALNNIYSLIAFSPEEAQKSVHSLSKLMRYMLYETNTEKVSLSKEIDFLKKYLELMQLRTSNKTTIQASFPDVASDVQIAPLLFISLIENAFKHGVSANQEGTLFFQMEAYDNEILFISRNPNLPKDEADKSGSGIGIQNLKKRLELLYPNKHKLVTRVVDNEFVVQLSIQLN